MKRLFALTVLLLLLTATTTAQRDWLHPLESAGIIVAAEVAPGGLQISLLVAVGVEDKDLGPDWLIATVEDAMEFSRAVGLTMTPKAALGLADALRGGEPSGLPLRLTGEGTAILERDSGSVTMLFSSYGARSNNIIARLTTTEAEELAGLLEATVDELLGR